MNDVKIINKYFTNIGNRKDVKNNVIKEFLNEEAGNENNSSKYKYIVENTLECGNIYLQRPGRFNRGVDFVIYTDNINFADINKRKRRNPKHTDILNDLQEKKIESENDFLKMKSMIDDIYNCKSDVNISDCQKLKFNTGFSVELILKILKWMFIEQDITYWNYSGREKLKKEIDKI
ncbi:hypothetical protein R4K54_12670 [Brachyspira murdochii]|uniref:hypothetical protein n=1 Tax=Brachyspira murdochii TaxID=84378 RepID=UPI0030058A80